MSFLPRTPSKPKPIIEPSTSPNVKAPTVAPTPAKAFAKAEAKMAGKPVARRAALPIENFEEPRVEKTEEVVSLSVPAEVVPWPSLGLSQELSDLLLKKGYTTPTPVQVKSIPRALDGKDLVVSAQTGTGKTMAFALPLLDLVFGRQGTCALVLAPTREIALQTHKVLVELGEPFNIHSVALIGGTPLRLDEIELKKYPQIIVSTPGRICDHLDRGNIWLDYLEVLVLDEADRMLEMGFSEQLNRILRDTPENRQTLMFSATLSPIIEKLAQKILYQPERIQIDKGVKSAKTVEQQFVYLHEEDKVRELRHLLHEERGTVFVFTRSKETTAKLWRTLRNQGFHEATQLHSGLTQQVREQALLDFKEGRYRVLIATDVVGRGIHVDEVAHVINFDLPRDADDYVHRIGRTGRANSTGKATTFVTPRDEPTLKKIKAVVGNGVQFK